jgi:hypothetical protein
MSHCLTYSITQQRRKYIEFFPTGEGCGLSLRKLIEDYTGYCVKVRRSSDDTEQDIGFTAGNVLDESALTTFVGAGDGFVSVWYDQFGNSNNATQTNPISQPKIVSSGTVIKEGTKPIIDFGISTDTIQLLLPSGFLYNTSDWSYFHVAKVKSFIGSNAGVFGPYNLYQKGLEILQHDIVTRRTLLRVNLDRKNDNKGETYQLWNDDLLCITSIFGGNGGLIAYKNNSRVLLTNSSPVNALNFNGIYSIGRYHSSINVGTVDNMYGKIAELIIYETNKLGVHPELRTNINNFYSIY